MTDLKKIPVTVITGFLGSGKTTLVRHLMLNPEGRRLAVLVNEFGTAGVDGKHPQILRGRKLPGRKHRGTGEWLYLLHRCRRIHPHDRGRCWPCRKDPITS